MTENHAHAQCAGDRIEAYYQTIIYCVAVGGDLLNHSWNQLSVTMCEPSTRIIPSAAASPSVLRKMYVL
jgi:hypothetical protein